MKAIHTPTGHIVEAIQWKGDNFKEFWDFSGGSVKQLKNKALGIIIKGSLWPVSIGEYVIRTSDGNTHVHSARYFEGHYKEKLADNKILQNGTAQGTNQ
jgi:hypothetical protein